jgi:hypothetical protein
MSSNAPVAIDSDDQRIAERPGLFQQLHVPGMQQVETPIREDNFLPRALQVLHIKAQIALIAHHSQIARPSRVRFE